MVDPFDGTPSPDSGQWCIGSVRILQMRRQQADTCGNRISPPADTKHWQKAEARSRNSNNV